MKVWFVVHDAGGAIIRTGTCSEAVASAQAMPGEIVMTFPEAQTFSGTDGMTRPITDLTHRVVDGALVPVES